MEKIYIYLIIWLIITSIAIVLSLINFFGYLKNKNNIKNLENKFNNLQPGISPVYQSIAPN